MLKKLMLFTMSLFVALGVTLTQVSAYSEIGSIKVELEKGVEGTSIEDVEFELVRVGTVNDGIYEYADYFSDMKTDLNEVKTSEKLQELAIELSKYADENDIKGSFDKTDSFGTVKFNHLEVGIYLLKVSDYAKYEYIEPTIISIPTYDEESQNSMKFDVTVIPKHTPFKVFVSKQDITDHKELEGAELQVTDKDGNIVDKWVSGKEPHMINNLFCNHSYTLTEVIAPKGYKIAQSIDFTVDATGEVQKVVMYDELLPKKVKTGDDANINALTTTLIASFAGIIALIAIKKRKGKIN